MNITPLDKTAPSEKKEEIQQGPMTEVPAEVLKIILNMAKDTPRSEVSRAWHEKVVTINKERIWKEVSDYTKKRCG